MITQPFDYYSPQSLDEVLQLITEHKDVKILAGGQSLIPVMNLGLSAPKVIVDLNRIKDLAYIKEGKANLAIGAMTTHEAVEGSLAIKNSFQILHEAVAAIGDTQVRNRGTIGGGICHADPAGDYPPVMVALSSTFDVLSNKKSREIAADDFFVDTFTTALSSDEILCEIRLPYLPARSGSAYVKHEYVSGGFAITSAAAVVTLNKDGSCNRFSVVIGGVSSVPIRLRKTEKVFAGSQFSEKIIEEIGQIAFEAATNPLSDLHADAEYRRHMAAVFAKRALRIAWSRAKGEWENEA